MIVMNANSNDSWLIEVNDAAKKYLALMRGQTGRHVRKVQ
jgi:hypothetical protein